VDSTCRMSACPCSGSPFVGSDGHERFGVGLAIAVLLDAIVVRLALTPALMTLLGKHNWAGPRWAGHVSRRLWHQHT